MTDRTEAAVLNPLIGFEPEQTFASCFWAVEALATEVREAADSRDVGRLQDLAHQSARMLDVVAAALGYEARAAGQV